ncbi:MAG: hypothetical protein BRC45_16835, partial [Cyanobacteria bacterium QS_5_48_63]
KMPLSFTDNKDFNPFPFVSFENFDVCFSAIGVELNTLIFVETRELKTVSARKVRVEFADHVSKFFWKSYFWSKSYAVSIAAGSVP